MKNFFKTLGKNIADSFRKKRYLWHISAFFATYALVISGFDWYYFLAMQSKVLYQIFWPGVAIGGILPLLLPLSLIISGKVRKNKRLEFFGWAIGQAALAGWLISSSYKSLTGRIQPDLANLTTDISDRFQFGFYEHGIFWGWPSSHTTVAFAMSVACAYILNNRLGKYLSIAYAFYIGIAVSFSIHWFSDFIAGAIIGTVIGMVVGKNFAPKLQQV